MNKQAKIKWEDSLWAARQQLLFFDSIGYKKMTACKGKGYFYAARGIYLELSGSGNTDSADKIKKEFAVFREKFWDRADLSDNEREWILYAFYPAKIKRQALMKKAANMLYRNKRGRKS